MSVATYESKFKFYTENEATENPENDPQVQKDQEAQKVLGILNTLKDENFGNEEQRRKFAKLIMSLCYSKAQEARNAIKQLGKVFSNWSNGNFDPETKEKTNESTQYSESNYDYDELLLNEIADWIKKGFTSGYPDGYYWELIINKTR